jgi:DNA-binding response OmpR family regulator
MSRSSTRVREYGVAEKPAAGKTSPPNPPRLSDVWRVLVVEKDSAEAESLASGIRRQGHEVVTVGTGSAALQVHGDSDLLLLDFELPDLDGLEVCRGIRAVSDVPIIAVTARGSELDLVLGLQAGADDFVVKPYGFRALLARMEAVMRRARPRPAAAKVPVPVRGPLRIDPTTRTVTLDGRVVDMTRKEFDLLHLLAANPDTVISRERLIRQVWGDSWSRRSLDTHVSSVRGKLGASTWIITVRGVGFRFGHG